MKTLTKKKPDLLTQDYRGLLRDPQMKTLTKKKPDLLTQDYRGLLRDPHLGG
jgi:hypothetical protein